MKVLEQSNDKSGIEYIVKNNYYVRVFDYGAKHILKRINRGNLHWCWMQLDKLYIPDDINLFSHSFDKAINTAVNDRYSTVYEFSSFNEVLENWDKVKYIDNIKIIYKSKEEE